MTRLFQIVFLTVMDFLLHGLGFLVLKFDIDWFMGFSKT